jgi:fructose-1,6-bisphosphatase II
MELTGADGQQFSTRSSPIEAQLSLELLPAVEQAAIECAKLMGWGKRDAADQAAVSALRSAMDQADIDGTVVIGEGERDEAPMPYIGERVGNPMSPFKVDIAVDPLEGTNLCAMGVNNAISVMAVSESGGLFGAPDTYMEKLVVPGVAVGKCDLDAPVAENARIVAQSLGRDVSEMVVVVLDRPRHEALIRELREAGCRIKLIPDGDLSAGINVPLRGTGIHMAVGIGGAPEGVVTAAALKCLGGGILGRFRPKDEEQRERCARMGVDLNRVYTTEELAPGKDIVFLASGVTKGDLLDGVRFFGKGVRVNSLSMTYNSQRIRFIDSVYMTERSGSHVEIQRL